MASGDDELGGLSSQMSLLSLPSFKKKTTALPPPIETVPLVGDLRACRRCGEQRDKRGFSNRQWRLAACESRCRGCTGEQVCAAAPAAAAAGDGLVGKSSTGQTKLEVLMAELSRIRRECPGEKVSDWLLD